LLKLAKRLIPKQVVVLQILRTDLQFPFLKYNGSMKQRRYRKRVPGDPDWVTSVTPNEEHVCMFVVDFSNGPRSEPVICGKNADVLLLWDRDSEPLPMCFEHYEERAKGRRTLNEYGKVGP
jgi:hypothetical protein